MRFDFTHFNAVTPQELAEVERIVNAKIFEALPVHIKVIDVYKRQIETCVSGNKTL